ncbi:hypothetical protein IT575_03655 [bacterium]|nr:hypothetical protein [bacterium]
MLLGKDLKDIHEEDVYGGPDPLANARKDLDFAAMASAAPSVKSILFKAQTMGPLPRTKPGGKTVGGVVAGVLALALIFLPWLQIHSSVMALQMGFEKELTRRQANELFSAMLRNEPRNTILSAGFTQIGQADAEGGLGHLRIYATGFDLSRQRMEESLRKLVIVHGSGGLEPMFSQSGLLESSSRVSPAGLLLARLRPQPDAYIGLQPQSSPALAATRHSRQLASGLAEALSTPLRSVQVLDSGFVSPVEAQEALESGKANFVLPAWPSDYYVKLQPYADLTAAEQEAMRKEAGGYLDSLGLFRNPDTTNTGLVQAAGVWLPVTVTVRDRSGNPDAYLSSRVQALVQQPSLEKLLAGPIDAESLVGSAVEQLLPRSQHREVAGDEYAWVEGRRVHVYNVQVYLQTGADTGTSSGKAGGMFDEAQKRLDQAAATEW